MRRAGKNRPRAIAHQHEIGDIDRQVPIGVKRVFDEKAGIEAQFFARLNIGFRCAALGAFGAKRGQRVIFCGQAYGQRMVGRNGAKARAIKRVGAGCVNLKRGKITMRRNQLKGACQTLRAADPIGLHQAHFFRPALQSVQRAQQLFRMVRDFQKPLRQLFLLDRRARAPALAVNHLLIGQHGLVDRVPIDRAFAPLHQTGVKEIQKHGLFMGVIRSVASGELARPINRQAELFQLRPHGVNIGVSPGAGMRAFFHRRIFRRHAERVPPHRVQNIKPLRFFEARHHIAHGVIAHMTHMDAARRIGKHFQHVIFRFAAIGRFGGKTVGGLPGGLPISLMRGGVICRHGFGL